MKYNDFLLLDFIKLSEKLLNFKCSTESLLLGVIFQFGFLFQMLPSELKNMYRMRYIVRKRHLSDELLCCLLFTQENLKKYKSQILTLFVIWFLRFLVVYRHLTRQISKSTKTHRRTPGICSKKEILE